MASVNTETFPGQKELQELIEKVKRAQTIYASYSQEQVDKIFRAAAIAANNARISLAQDAVQETGMGIIEDKVIKNHFAAEYIFHKYKDDKTCGIIEEDTGFGIEKIAEPKGVICGIIPTTNPTSTAIFKSLIALKTRNAIIFSPHPRAKKCTCDAARIVRDAAVAAGAPEDIVAWIDEPTMDKTDFLMHHPLVNLILATGGPGMVKSAYSSGKPAIGVGAGNTPALIDKSANIKMAVASILMSKTFDNGVVCASEQAIIVHKDIYDEVKKEFKAMGAHFLNKEEMAKLSPIILDPQRGSVNPKIVGQPASTIAKIAGFEVDPKTKVLIGEVSKVAVDEPFAHEKLSPVLGMYKCGNFGEGADMAARLIALGGLWQGGQDQQNPDQHAGKPGSHRRHLQLPPRAEPHARMRIVGQQLHLGERRPEASAQRQDTCKEEREHAVVPSAAKGIFQVRLSSRGSSGAGAQEEGIHRHRQLPLLVRHDRQDHRPA